MKIHIQYTWDTSLYLVDVLCGPHSGHCMVTLCISVPSLTFTTSVLYHWSVWSLCGHSLYFSAFPYIHHLCTIPLVSVVTVWSLSVFQCLPLHSPPLYYTTGQCGHCVVTLCISVPSLTFTTSVLCHWSVWSLYSHSLYFSAFLYTHCRCSAPRVGAVTSYKVASHSVPQPAHCIHAVTSASCTHSAAGAPRRALTGTAPV